MRVHTSPRIVLFSKAGYSNALHRLATEDPRIELIDVPAALDGRCEHGQRFRGRR